MSNYFLDKKKRSDRAVCDPGSRIHVPTKWTYKDGEYVIVDDKPINLYERIQAARDSVDLQLMIQRYKSGDRDALDRVDALYFDAFDAPTSYAQLFEKVEDLKLIFDRMPSDIKNKFDNNPAKFWKKSGSLEFDAVLNDWRSAELSKVGMIDANPVKTAPDMEVKSDES